MLKVNQISVGYTNDKNIIEDISFSLQKGEILCVMGESGSGKSTLLRTLYGLLDTNKGTIFWGDKQITGPKDNLVAGFENFKYVSQEFDLMPYISVSENIGKFLPRFDMQEREKRIDELLDIIDLKAYKHTKVQFLSGGQQQRVAIARALATQPQLLLLDEAFAQIDNFKRNSLRRKLFKTLKQENISCIISTHDSENALSFADKIIIIKDGKILLKSTPKQLYNTPSDLYSASLLGDINQLSIDGHTHLLYPNQIKITEYSDFKALVINSYFKGSHWLIECDFNGQVLFINHDKCLIANKNICFKIQST